MELTALHAGLLALCTLNLLTFGVYWHDKESARDGKRRVRESTLLWLALVGGSIGAVLAQQLLRHKTRKEPSGLCCGPYASCMAGCYYRC